MQAEIKINSILKENSKPQKMVEEICLFMDWGRDKLLTAIKKHGCSTTEARGKITAEFWGKPKRKWN